MDAFAAPGSFHAQEIIMNTTLRTAILGSALWAAFALPVGAQSLMDGLKDQAATGLLGGGGAATPASSTGLGSMLGGSVGAQALGLPGISGDMAGNVAGVLQYCIQNNVLGGADAASIQESLLSKAGLGSPQEQQQDIGYQQGLSGLLSGDGGSFDVSKLKDNIKTKACDYVLDNATSLI
ncbi:DUF2501 domain-containing protein [Castellaniella sp.]|uniref:DUF2501 domain-containing protein n=1 Tax=Castellaniella sp. TaxID=1955812 RepID=UPI0035664BD4